METTIEYKDHTIQIERDEFAENPLENWCLTGNIGYCNNRYVLGNKMLSRDELVHIENSEDYVSIPVFAYIHSGVTIKASEGNPFHCNWDSGQSGIVYISKEEAKKEFGWKRISPQREEALKMYLRNTVIVYSDYLEGNVYGYRIEDGEGQEIDSCWGFFGDPEGENGVLSEAKRIIDHHFSK